MTQLESAIPGVPSCGKFEVEWMLKDIMSDPTGVPSGTLKQDAMTRFDATPHEVETWFNAAMSKWYEINLKPGDQVVNNGESCTWDGQEFAPAKVQVRVWLDNDVDDDKMEDAGLIEIDPTADVPELLVVEDDTLYRFKLALGPKESAPDRVVFVYRKCRVPPIHIERLRPK